MKDIWNNLPFCDQCGENITNRFKMEKPKDIKIKEFEFYLHKKCGDKILKRIFFILINVFPVVTPYHIINCMCFCSKKCSSKYRKYQLKREE